MININDSEHLKEEGYIFNTYLKSRVIDHNFNTLATITGSTGSGKSYTCLRIAELWYKKQFNEKFPVENICFSLEELIELLKSKKLKRGSIVILEEAGCLLNSLDFQNKIQKTFTFILQSFRSLNIILIMNLPVLTMLNKSARLLLHCHFTTAGINHKEKKCKIKPKLLQTNQSSGKVYNHFPNIVINNRSRKIQRFNYQLPSTELIEEYEKKKEKFVYKLIDDFDDVLSKPKQTKVTENGLKPLTEMEEQVFIDWKNGLSARLSAEKRGKSQPAIVEARKRLRTKGYNIEKK